MKDLTAIKFFEQVPGMLFIAGLACALFAGCAEPSKARSGPTAGKGIAEYRELTLQAHRAVANTIESLEALRGASIPASRDPRIARFDRAFNELELTSMKARIRAEAIIARGQNYFDEWGQQLAENRTTHGEKERYDRLSQHFTRVRERSSEVRGEFRPFLTGLRRFRASLDQKSGSAQSDSVRAEIDALTTSGRRLLNSLESVSTALDDAETELHVSLSSTK